LPAEQFNIPPTLISRFDLIFPIRDELDKKRDAELAEHILVSHYTSGMRLQSDFDKEEIEKAEERVKPDIEPELLRKYIAYARSHVRPVLTPEAIERIKNFYLDLWEKTGRWDDVVVDDWFKTKLKNGTELGLAFTHEEALTNIMKNFVSSYKDLPIYAYQFQTKFRNELRAKSGIMRGREFLMKDLYDFSLDEKDHKEFYELMKGVYMNIFTRVGIGDKTYLTMSSGGSFSKYSSEFQTITDAGEDTILYDEEKKVAVNKDHYSKEIFKDFGLNEKDFNLKEAKSVEVGDIYTLGEKYSKALGLTYKSKEGEDMNVYMGSYGIGISRLMGAIVEVWSDDHGLVWPEEITPFMFHLTPLGDDDKEVNVQAKELYDDLQKNGVSILYDDRKGIRPGERFADSDLLGMPYRIVVSKKTLAEGKLEVKERRTGEVKMIDKEELFKL